VSMRLLSLSAAALFLAACADLEPPTSTAAAGLDQGPSFSGGSTHAVIINEVMADPEAVSDGAGEWFELHNRGTSSVDVQGWTIHSGGDAARTINASVVIPAGGYAVLARNGDSGTNGGVAVDYAWGTGIGLGNSSDWLAIRDAGGASVDSVHWSMSVPKGISRGVQDPALAHDNMMGANWLHATSTYGSGGDKGTPGAPNDGKRGGMTVHVIDAGQADAVYIENGSSRIMIDAGQGIGRIDDLIAEMGLVGGTLDVLMISHAHFDHHGGARAFFKTVNDVEVRYVFENQDPSTSLTLIELRDSISARVGRGETIYRDTDDPCGNGSAVCTIHLDGGARLHVLRPRPTGGVNDRSFAAKLVGPDSASFTMWLSGDAEHDALHYFEDAGYDVHPGMDVHVLKGNHHGSCNGISTRFLQLTSPQWVTFGVSATNSYGHVHEQTKDLLTTLSIPWYRSDGNGRITFWTPGTPGGGYTVEVEKGTASMDGDGDGTSSQTACSSL
jgi:beta-lactamase superfamily II metal-dependent hydrolase